MNYIGSKRSLLPFLDETIRRISAGHGSRFCDLFAGTGVVGRHFKTLGYQVIANDIQFYSYVLNRHYIGTSRPFNFAGLLPIIPYLSTKKIDDRPAAVCRYLSKLPGKDGFIYRHYCLGGTIHTQTPRLYFSDDNGRRGDAIRLTIQDWYNQTWITDDEYFFLLASIIESMDRHANTASVYGAFLKQLKDSAKAPMVLRPADCLFSDSEHQVYQLDTAILAKQLDTDILYLDPPYNERQYAANYHVLETIARYDNPLLQGKTGLRPYTNQRSDYCLKRKVMNAFETLISSVKASVIFLSYNNEGLMSMDDIAEIMSRRGDYGYVSQSYSRFKSDRDRAYKSRSTTEYLHYIKPRFFH